MRIFIAAEFEHHIKDYIKKIQQGLKTYILDGNFTKIDNLHLTLKFIGEIDKDNLADIYSVVNSTVHSFNQFSLFLDKLGYFPIKNKKLLWLGITNTEELVNLVSILNNQLSLYGIQKDIREYNPHITLVRRAELNKDFSLVKTGIDIEDKRIKVKKISVMESNRINGLLVYRPLYSAYLL